MPVVHSSYKPSFFFRSGHIATIYPTLMRRITGLSYERERLITPDDDFFDLDWSRKGSRHIALILHGLESSSDASYVKGMVRVFNAAGWDAVAMNFRGCSGELNRRPGSYHAGKTIDVAQAIEHIAGPGEYDQLMLIGFSLGGNVVLNYLGREPDAVNPIVQQAMAISTPIDLASSATKIDQDWQNRIYLRRFLKRLNEKAYTMAKRFPGLIDERIIPTLTTIRAFDHLVTAQINGFDGVDDYYARASSKQHLLNIQLPTLILSAEDDSFLAPPCFPDAEAEQNPYLTLERSPYGGHVGFVLPGLVYYSEARAIELSRRRTP